MEKFKELKEYLEFKKRRIEEKISELFPQAQGYGKRVILASAYSLKSGGKRLRPILCLIGYEICGQDPEDILIFACGLECLHTYSLIHDDLPCMDDDAFRRGKPSCHKAFDEATALLAGDGLQALAFEWFSHPEILKKVDPKVLIKAIHLVARASGLNGMVAGQMADLLSEGKKGSPKLLQWIHKHKTVALISASLLSGGILAQAPKNILTILKNFGEELGLLFQITDDLLDLIGNEKELGKPLKSDLKKQKLTYPLLFGIEETQKLAQETAKKAIHLLKPLGEGAKLLEDLTYYILERAK